MPSDSADLGSNSPSNKMDHSTGAAVQQTPANLDHIESQGEGLFIMLQAEVESLKETAKQTQVKGLKKSVDHACSIIKSIEKNNTEIKTARAQQAINKIMVVDAKKVVTILNQHFSTVVDASSKAVLDAISSIKARTIENTSNEVGDSGTSGVRTEIENLQTMLAAQDVKIDKMA